MKSVARGGPSRTEEASSVGMRPSAIFKVTDMIGGSLINKEVILNGRALRSVTRPNQIIMSMQTPGTGHGTTPVEVSCRGQTQILSD